MINTYNCPILASQRRLISIARAIRIPELYQAYLTKYPTGDFASEAELYLASGIRIWEGTKASPQAAQTQTKYTTDSTRPELADLSALAKEFQSSLAQKESAVDFSNIPSGDFQIRRRIQVFFSIIRAYFRRLAWSVFQY